MSVKAMLASVFCAVGVLLMAVGCGLSREERWELRAEGMTYRIYEHLYVKPADETWVIRPIRNASGTRLVEMGGLRSSIPPQWAAGTPQTERHEMPDYDAIVRYYAMEYKVTLTRGPEPSWAVEFSWNPEHDTAPEDWWWGFGEMGRVSAKQLQSYCGSQWGFVEKTLNLTPAELDLERLAQGDVEERVKLCLLDLKNFLVRREYQTQVEKFVSGTFSGFVIWCAPKDGGESSGMSAARVLLAQRGRNLGALTFRVQGTMPSPQLRELVKTILGSLRFSGAGCGDVGELDE